MFVNLLSWILLVKTLRHTKEGRTLLVLTHPKGGCLLHDKFLILVPVLWDKQQHPFRAFGHTRGHFRVLRVSLNGLRKRRKGLSVISLTLLLCEQAAGLFT